jgi:HMG (high mobility group) box
MMACSSPADPSEAATVAFLSYLRMESELSDHRAKVLRDQADQLAALYGIQQDLQDRYGACSVVVDRHLVRYRTKILHLTCWFHDIWYASELGPELAPPLDANGIPKYRGKKRGRKPKERKRKVNPNRRKRSHTAYTLFVHERYPSVKKENPHLQSKEVISIVARLWAAVPLEEKRVWKERAISSAKSQPSAVHAENNNDDDDDDEYENGEGEEEEDGEDEDGEDTDFGKDEAEMAMLESAGGSVAFDNESPADDDRREIFSDRQSSSRRRRR